MIAPVPDPVQAMARLSLRAPLPPPDGVAPPVAATLREDTTPSSAGSSLHRNRDLLPRSLGSSGSDTTQLPLDWRQGLLRSPGAVVAGSFGPSTDALNGAVSSTLTEPPLDAVMTAMSLAPDASTSGSCPASPKRRRTGSSSATGSHGSLASHVGACMPSRAHDTVSVASFVPLRVEVNGEEGSSWKGRPRSLATSVPRTEATSGQDGGIASEGEMDVDLDVPSGIALDDLVAVETAQAALAKRVYELIEAAQTGADVLSQEQNVARPFGNVLEMVSAKAREVPFPSLVQMAGRLSDSEPMGRGRLRPLPLTCEMQSSSMHTCRLCNTIEAEKADLCCGGVDIPIQLNNTQNVGDTGPHHRELYPELTLTTQDLLETPAVPGVGRLPAPIDASQATSTAVGQQRRLSLTGRCTRCAVWKQMEVRTTLLRQLGAPSHSTSP